MIDNETHTTERLEKLSNRSSRRLTITARDYPVVDRETPNMRATYQSNTREHDVDDFDIAAQYLDGSMHVPQSTQPVSRHSSSSSSSSSSGGSSTSNSRNTNNNKQTTSGSTSSGVGTSSGATRTPQRPGLAQASLNGLKDTAG